MAARHGEQHDTTCNSVVHRREQLVFMWLDGVGLATSVSTHLLVMVWWIELIAHLAYGCDACQ